MKAIFIFILLFSVNGFADEVFGRKPCPKPKPAPAPVVVKKEEARYSSAEHLLVSGMLSPMAYKVFRTNKVKKKFAYMLAVTSAVLVGQALEPSKEGKKDSLAASFIGAALSPVLFFEF